MTRFFRFAKQTCVKSRQRHRAATIAEESGTMPATIIAFRTLKISAGVFLAFFALPLGAHSVVHWTREAPANWSSASWASTGELPKAERHEPAMVRVFAARTGRWRGNFAVHSWIVLKTKGGQYERYDKVGWGNPIRQNGYPPDGLWYSNRAQTVFAADGGAAEKLIPALRASIAAYPYSSRGSYNAWPGPNSNTFISCVTSRVAGMTLALPPNAIGKDYPCDGSWFGLSPSQTGFRVNLGGYLGLMAGWVEGLELNILGAVAGVDIRRPALKLPGFGRIGMHPT